MPANVLVVDDDPEIRRNLTWWPQMGHQVTSAANGSDGLAALKSAMPDLVLLDIEMPVMNGIELLKEVKRQLPDVFVILMTGLGGARETGAAFQHGADGFLQKPVKLAALLAGIRRIERSK